MVSIPKPLLAPGVVAPILTPFEVDGSLSLGRMVEHAHRLLDSGCVGLAVFGTTGEALSMASAERMAALEALVESGIDPGLLIVGTGLTNLPETVGLTRHAVSLDCRACMVLPPFYFKEPSPEGLFNYFAGLVDAVADDRLRIMLYHIPQVAGVGLPVSLAARLRREFSDTVVAIKDSSGDRTNTQALFDIDGLVVYPGSELQLLDALDRGGSGCITSTGNVNAELVAEVIRRHGEGNRDAAVVAMESVRAVRKLIEQHSVIPTLKGLLAYRLGDPMWASVRPPFIESDPKAVAELAMAISEVAS